MQRRWLATLLAGVLLGWSQPATARSIRFDELPALVAQHNLGVRGSHEFVKSAQVSQGYFGRSFLPRVSAFGGGERFLTRDQPWMTQPTAGAAATINLFRGGRDLLEDRKRTWETARERAAADHTVRQTLQHARDLFVQALYLHEIIAHYQSALAANRDTLAMVARRIDAGLTTATDRLDCAIYHARLEQELAIVEEEHEHALELLQSVLGLPWDKPLHLTGSLGHDHHDPMFALSVSEISSPDIQALEHESSRLATASTQATRWWTPEVDVYAQYTLFPFRERESHVLRERDDTVFGVQARVHLFDGLRAARKAKDLQLRARGVYLKAAQQTRELEARFRKLHHILQLRHRLVHGVRQSVAHTHAYLQRTRQEYELGTKNSPDVLNAAERILDQQRRYSEIRRDFLLTKNELLALQGE